MLRLAWVRMGLFVACAAVAWGAAAPAEAQTIVTRLTDAKIEQLLEDAGATGIEKLEELEDPDSGFLFMHADLKHVMFVNHRTRSLQLFIGYDSDEGMSREQLEKARLWNQEEQYGRAYVAKSGQRRLEIDLTYRHGVTEEALVALIEEFCEKSVKFGEFLED